jgi:hypothetical protein
MIREAHPLPLEATLTNMTEHSIRVTVTDVLPAPPQGAPAGAQKSPNPRPSTLNPQPKTTKP